jgi:competence protein ComEC
MALQVIFMDSGQGDATLLVYPDGSLVLIDCGCIKNTAKVTGEIETILTKYLNKTGNKLRALVLTHNDQDHYNMVRKMIDVPNVQVGHIFIGGQISFYKTGDLASWLQDNEHITTVFKQPHCSLEPVKALSLPATKQYPAVEVRILAANALDPNNKDTSNENSIVLMVTHLDVNLFLMGDATEYTESFILQEIGQKFQPLLSNKRTALKVGHHGSDTSSTTAWINKIRPELAFISSDTKAFGGGPSLPRGEIISRFTGSGYLHDFGNNYIHDYVQFNRQTDKHEDLPTTLGLYTTLYLLDWDAAKTEFVSYGTSWHYTIAEEPSVAPSCGWDQVYVAFQ